MGVLGEFLIISATAFAGILLSRIPGFPLPGAVTGMILMLIMLLSGVIKLKNIGRAADFFLKYLALFFVPLVVNLIRESKLLAAYGFRLVLVIIATTLITLAATGLTARLLLAAASRGKKND